MTNFTFIYCTSEGHRSVTLCPQHMGELAEPALDRGFGGDWVNPGSRVVVGHTSQPCWRCLVFQRLWAQDPVGLRALGPPDTAHSKGLFMMDELSAIPLKYKADADAERFRDKYGLGPQDTAHSNAPVAPKDSTDPVDPGPNVGYH